MKAHFEQEIKELKQAIIPQEKQNIIDHSASRYNSSDLEARVDALEDLVSDLGTALVAVASEVDDLEEETTEHDDQIETIGYTVYLHGEQISTLEQSITLLEDDINILEESDTSQDTRLTALEQTSTSHEQRIDDLESNSGPDTEPIGFHARLTSTMGQQGILLFDDILSNVGNNYDPSSGQFTAARQGIYFFSFYADIDSDSTVEMYIGKTGVAQCWADGDGNGPDTIEQSISCSAFMELDIGDVVYVYVWSSDKQTPFEEAEKCGFTGFMLQSSAFKNFS